ncbi:MAG: hypothetical protein NHB32_15125 [Fischerella sp. CENA71]|nr:hypothetical protein [Fischerella sp. CENA71]
MSSYSYVPTFQQRMILPIMEILFEYSKQIESMDILSVITELTVVKKKCGQMAQRKNEY